MTNESIVDLGGQLKTYKVYFNLNGKAIHINVNNILETVMRHSYYRNFASGYIKLRDATGIFDILTVHFTLTIILELEDCMGLRTNEVFAVTNIEKVNDPQHGMLVYVEFIDEITNLLTLTHISKGFKNVSFPEVFGGIYDFLSKGLIYKKRASISNLSNFEKKDFIIPGNISLYKWIMEQEYYENFEFVIGRDTISILSTKNLWKNTHSTGIKLIVSNNKILSPLTVKNLQVIQDSLQTRMDLAPTTSYSLKDGTNTISVEHSNPVKSLYELGAGDSLELSGSSIHLGSKITAFDGIARQKFCNSKILEDQVLSVTPVMGSFMYCPTMKVNVEIPTSIKVEGHKVPYLNGEYMITYIEDVITGSFFGQTLTLSRPGVNKK